MQEHLPLIEDGAGANGSATDDSEAPPETHQAHTLPEAKERTIARARDLRVLLGHYVRRHLPPAEHATHPAEPLPQLAGSHARLLSILAVIPGVLTAVFALSFFWDFNGVSAQAFGYALELDGLLRILSVSGLIGFLTNWVAILMLFHPRKPRPIFGQGLIPAQRERVIHRLARAVSEELINETIIKQKIEESQVIPRYRELALGVTRGVLEDPEFRQDVKALTAAYVEEVLASEDVRRKITDFAIGKLEQQAGHGLGGFALRTYRYLNEADFQRRIEHMVRELPSSVDGAMDNMDHLLDRIPEKIEARSEEIEAFVTKAVLGFVEKLNVYDMIVSNMRQYDEQKLEQLFQNSANEQLNYIKYLGGVLGVVGGLVIWKPLPALLLFGAVGLILVLIDRALYRAPTAPAG